MTHSSARIITALCAAGLVAALIVLAAEASARLAIARMVPHSYEVSRNPHRRFWQQYTAPRPRPAGERRVILISNSQGHVGGDDTYPHLLERHLNAADPRHRHTVANWSYEGGNAPDMIVLAARAAAHRPDALLLVSYSRNFTKLMRDSSIASSGDDLHHLAYLPEVRRHLSDWFIERYRITSRHAWLASRSRLVQLHEVFASLVKGRARRMRPALTKAAAWSDSAERLLDEFHATLRRGLPDTPLVVVSMPLNFERFTPESPPNLREFPRRARLRLGGEPGVTVLDAIQLVEPALMLDDTHLAPEGHARFARWLVEPLLASLAPRERALATAR